MGAGGGVGAQHADKQAGGEGAVVKTMPIDAMVIGAHVAVAHARHPADGDKDIHDELQHQFLVKAVPVDADLCDAPLHGIRELRGDREIGFRDDHSVGDHLLRGGGSGTWPTQTSLHWLVVASWV